MILGTRVTEMSIPIIPLQFRNSELYSDSFINL